MGKTPFKYKCYAMLWEEHRNEIAESTNGFVHVACKSCGEELHRSGIYSPRSNLYRCFQPGCDFHNWRPVLEYMSQYSGRSISELEVLVKRKKGRIPDETFLAIRKKEMPKAIDLPIGCIPIDQGNTFLYKRACKYLHKRSFDVNWLYEKYRMYYIQDSHINGEHCRYFARIIVPFFDIYGDVVYFQARDFLETRELRWDNPSRKLYNVGKDQVLFNIRSLYLNKVSIGTIHEGVFDAVEMEKPIGIDLASCSIGGLTISPEQLFMLSMSTCTKLYIILDPGTWKETLEMALALYCMCDKEIYCVDMRDGDCNEVGKLNVIKLFEEAPLFDLTFYTYELLNMERQGVKTYRGRVSKKFKIFNF